MSNNNVNDSLAAGLHQLQITADSLPLINYLTLLQKWNNAYNLTGVKHVEDMVSRHILDSLAIALWIKGNTVIDVGSGAGLPGIPLALAFPHLHVVLLDSNGKKISFLQEAKRVLQLDNITIVQARVETYRPPAKFAVIVSRAFSELQQMISLTKHLVANPGMWLAMKGKYPAGELQGLSYPYQVKQYTVPGLAGERCCVLIDNFIQE